MGMVFRAIVPPAKLVKDPTRDLEAALAQWGEETRQAVSPYPTARTTYRRTGRLGRNWRVKASREQGALVMTVDNPVEYAPYVQGDDADRVWWAGIYGWQSITDVARFAISRLEERIGAAFQKSVQ